MLRLVIPILVATSGLASARDWPSEAHRGRPQVAAPCTCRGPNVSAEVGTSACLITPTGGRRGLCTMNQNVTSWTMTDESCGATTMLGPIRARLE